MSFFEQLKRHHWDLAFVEPQNNDWLNGSWKFSWVKYSTRKRWFADPFILDVTNNDIKLLVEEYTYSRGRGRIAKVNVDRKTLKVIYEKVLLELPTHLSFPAILRQGDDIIVYPENAESGKLNAYKYDPQKETLQLITELAEAPLSDAIIMQGDGESIIFATEKPNSNGNVLMVYSADSYLGHYNKKQEIVFGERIARNAGETFMKNDLLIRPAQIYLGKFGYGAGISFQEIKKAGKSYSIHEIARVLPPQGYDGMHTFNMYKGVAVVDCRHFNHPFLHSITSFIKHKILK